MKLHTFSFCVISYIYVIYDNAVRKVIDISFECGRHSLDHIISLGGEVWTNKTSLTPPLFNEIPVPRQESKRSCICV